jgi:CRP-like cAMP-binding protein
VEIISCKSSDRVGKAPGGTSAHCEQSNAPRTALAPAPSRVNALIAGAALLRRKPLWRLLEPVALSFGEILQEADVIRHVYFPVDCLVSLFVPVSDHLAVEAGMVGSEGMVGVSLALGERASSVRALVQGSGTALRMEGEAFRRELGRNAPLQAGVSRYVHLLMGQLSQTVACNTFHAIEARCARWLLMTRDRMQSDELELTHEFLARMLGVRRVGVTVAAGNLRKQGLISYSRGRITILNAEQLAGRACECYSVLQKLYGGAGA